ncbi:MAG TPA: hypothetical protein IAB18_00470 [Candidatus Avisuccinivibrio pullicola]|nr:hypothetical protein [Candidatus Avisuccinivibrio pullicola]
MYNMAIMQVIRETSLEFPENCPWSCGQILEEVFSPV